MSFAEESTDLVIAPEKLEWVTPQIYGLMEVSETERKLTPGQESGITTGS